MLILGSAVTGVGAAWAGVKQIPGIGIRVRKNPGGPTTRVRAVLSDAAGQFSITVSEAGNQSLDIDKAALQLAVNGEAEQRIVVVRFNAGLRVIGPNGQTPVTGNPGTFILTSGNQTFTIARMASGSVISGQIETVDETDLFPAISADKGIRDNGVKGCGDCGLTGRMIPEPQIARPLGQSGQ